MSKILVDYTSKPQLFKYRKESNTQALNPQYLNSKENFVLEVVNRVVDDYFDNRSTKGLSEMLIDSSVCKDAQNLLKNELKKEVNDSNKPNEEDLKSVCDCQNRLVKAIERNNNRKLGMNKYVYPLILIIVLVIWYIMYKYQGMLIPFALTLSEMFGILAVVFVPFRIYKSETNYRKELLREETVLEVLEKLTFPSV